MSWVGFGKDGQTEGSFGVFVFALHRRTAVGTVCLFVNFSLSRT
jgi:hypothetical protein